jgi:hypothetical protein
MERGEGSHRITGANLNRASRLVALRRFAAAAFLEKSALALTERVRSPLATLRVRSPLATSRVRSPLATSRVRPDESRGDGREPGDPIPEASVGPDELA